MMLNPLSANPTKWSNALKQFVSCVFDNFVGLALKGLKRNFLGHVIELSPLFFTYSFHRKKSLILQ